MLCRTLQCYCIKCRTRQFCRQQPSKHKYGKHRKHTLLRDNHGNSRFLLLTFDRNTVWRHLASMWGCTAPIMQCFPHNKYTLGCINKAQVNSIWSYVSVMNKKCFPCHQYPKYSHQIGTYVANSIIECFIIFSCLLHFHGKPRFIMY